MNTSRRQFVLDSAAVVLATSTPLQARREPLRVLIIDGVNNHDWRAATAGMRETLLRSGRFRVDVSTTPPRDSLPAQWPTWKPEFSRYHAVINNFNGGETEEGLLWPAEVRKSLEAYVHGGGGLVIFHAANNAFLSWQAYNDMIGLGWRKKTFGRGIRIGDHDEVIYIPQGEGIGPGHPERMDFQINVRQIHHPITEGMPGVWMHPSEQLTHGQHGPAEGLTILTYAASPISHANEPMDWVHNYGKGRVYTTLLGHTWAGEPSPDLECVGFQTLFARGVEWAASGGVSIPIPQNFPGPSRVSLNPLHR
jgi:uncharacterized protein